MLGWIISNFIYIKIYFNIELFMKNIYRQQIVSKFYFLKIHMYMYLYMS